MLLTCVDVLVHDFEPAGSAATDALIDRCRRIIFVDVYKGIIVVVLGRPGRRRLGGGRRGRQRGRTHLSDGPECGYGRRGFATAAASEHGPGIRYGPLVQKICRVQLELLFALFVLLPGPSLGRLFRAVLARGRGLGALGARTVAILAVPLVLLPHLAQVVVLAVGAQPLLFLGRLTGHGRRPLLLVVLVFAGRHFRTRENIGGGSVTRYAQTALRPQRSRRFFGVVRPHYRDIAATGDHSGIYRNNNRPDTAAAVTAAAADTIILCFGEAQKKPIAKYARTRATDYRNCLSVRHTNVFRPRRRAT